MLMHSRVMLMCNRAAETDYAALASEMPTNIPTGLSINAPPSSIMSILLTAIPVSYLNELSNPSSRSSMFSEISAGHYPDWYKSLPGDVKTYISTAYQTDAKATGADKTGDITVTSGAQATPTGTTESDSSNTSTSEAGAAAPTGAIAASLAGAAGILGLAIAL
ncbi:hypothetical protein BDV25DRAFT_164659 [Aspergillus avenaceus]|uniref:Uncharacterized protein n=1 Tax=Aspergillus avenaceus TaxID=36643 RepID=A0A5N6TGE7_ASPAV|nr:hypothetical protein BDV25DRAFT_164659 [Aspergillus avenaceus]